MSEDCWDLLDRDVHDSRILHREMRVKRQRISSCTCLVGANGSAAFEGTCAACHSATAISNGLLRCVCNNADRLRERDNKGSHHCSSSS